MRVDYEVGSSRLDHLAYAKALNAIHRFPRPEGEALADFEDLAADLYAFGGIFLDGRASRFHEIAKS